MLPHHGIQEDILQDPSEQQDIEPGGDLLQVSALHLHLVQFNPTIPTHNLCPQDVVYLDPRPRPSTMSPTTPIRRPIRPPTPHPLSPPTPSPASGPVVLQPAPGPMVCQAALPAAPADPDPVPWWFGLLHWEHQGAAASLLNWNIYLLEYSRFIIVITFICNMFY